MQSKNDLRKTLKFQTSSIDPEISYNIVNNCLQLLKSFEFNTLGIYYAINDEPRIDAVINYYQDKKKFAAPKILQQEMIFSTYALYSNLEVSSFATLQTISNKQIIPDVMLIPGLAFDIKGYRLGHGRGFYDQYLAKFGSNILKIGLHQSSKLIACINLDEHDIKMDYLINEKEILKTC